MSGSRDSRVGLLGTGLMGSAMAHRLLDEGVAVIAWTESPITCGHSQSVAPKLRAARVRWSGALKR